MPGEPPDPGIVQSFLDACAGGSWNERLAAVVTAAGDNAYPRVDRSTTWPAVGQWTLAATGDRIAQNVYDTLRGGTANPDGSFTDAAGARHYLGSSGGWAVLA